MKRTIVLAALILSLLGLRVYAQKTHRSDADLQQRYEVYDNAYFDGKLPHNVPVTWKDIPLTKDGRYDMGITHWQRFADGSEAFSIDIDTKTNVAQVTADLTLLHEMCHVATDDYVHSHGEDAHGPAFQACRVNLEQQDALKDLF